MKTSVCATMTGVLFGVVVGLASATEPRACCCPDGTCTDVDKPTCFDLGGDTQGGGVVCNQIDECPPTWACDLVEGGCENKSFEHCDGVGGTWREGEICDGTDCSGGSICGDGVLDPGEVCDDGNNDDGDGCSANCLLEPAPCRVTGGGVDCFDGILRDGECSGASGKVKKLNDFDVYTFGGQAGAPDSLHGEWTHVQHDGPDGKWTFHAGTASAPPDTYTHVIACSDEPACDPAAANGTFKQIDFAGVGSFRNILDVGGGLGDAVEKETLHPYSVHIEDLGEPGRSGKQGPDTGCQIGGYAGELADCECPDFYHITIWDTTGTTVIYEIFGYITGGNLQIHEALD